MRPPRAVLFDLDDTLADRSAAIGNYARTLAGDFAAALGSPEHLHAALIASDDFGSLRQAQRLSAASCWRDPIDAAVLYDHWAARFGEAATPFPDVAQVLGELRDRDIQLGIITNGGAAMQRAKIAALDLERLMSVIVISQEVGLRKPDAAIFRHALAGLDCQANEAWFIGDNPEVDVVGAVGAGLRGFWVETANFTPPAPPAERLSGLGDLLRFL